MRKLGRLLVLLVVVMAAALLVPQFGGACDPVPDNVMPCSR